MATRLAGVLLCCVSLLFPLNSFAQFPGGQINQAIVNLSNVIGKVQAQVDQASPDAKSKLGEMAQPTPELKPQPELANESDRTVLCAKVGSFGDSKEAQAKIYSKLTLGSIILSTVLALVGSIASFLSKNKTAGIISLVVASIVGLSNAYPVGPLSAYYSQLAGEAKALSVDCELTKPYTTTAYASDVNQYRLLVVYEDKRPAFGNPRVATDELTKELQTVRTASNNVTVAQK